LSSAGLAGFVGVLTGVSVSDFRSVSLVSETADLEPDVSYLKAG
jgi:hypothetical protein